MDLELFKSKEIELNREVKALQSEYQNQKRSHKETRAGTDPNTLDRILRAYDLSVEYPDWPYNRIAKELLGYYETLTNVGASRNSSKVDTDLKAARKYISQAPYIPFTFKWIAQENIRNHLKLS